MPVTYYTFLAGSLALAGIFPFAGFWSKDEALFETLDHALEGDPLLLVGYAMGLIAVVLTAFYTFRMVFLTFHGEPRTDQAEDPEPVGWNMKVPLIVLGVLSAIGGILNLGLLKDIIGTENLFLHEWLDGATFEEELAAAPWEVSVEHYGEVLPYDAAHISPWGPGAVAFAFALAGLGLAWYLYRGPEHEPHLTSLGSVRTLLANNYYQDEYQVWLARDVTLPVARGANTFDQGVIDGIIDGAGAISLYAGDRFRKIQTGVVTNYAALLTLSLVLLLLAFGILGGWWV